MKKLTFSFVLIILICFLTGTPLFANGGTIKGEIYYENDVAAPVVVMAVRIPPSMNQLYYPTVIQGVGSYEITDLPDGLYLVGAFIDFDGSEGPNPGEPVGIYPDFVLLKDNATMENINISLVKLPAGSGAISGKVLYNGKQAGPVKIISLGISHTPFNYQMVNITEDNTYKIDNLKDGNYIIVGYMDVNKNGLPGLSEPLGTVMHFIPVVEGEETPNIDIKLTDEDGYSGSVSGRLTYEGTKTGQTMVGILGPSRTPMKLQSVSSANGEYQVGGLATGKYGACAFIDLNEDGRPNATEPMGYYTNYLVDVWNGKNTPDVNIRLIDPPQGTGEISGEVTTDGYWFTKSFVKIYENIVVQAIGISETPLVSTKLEKPGKYHLTGLKSGFYIVMAYSDENGDRMYSIGEPVGFHEKIPVMVSEFAPTENVNIKLGEMANTRANIKGTITYQGDKTGPIQVYGFGSSMTPLVQTSLAQPGDYELTGAAAGNYLLMSFMDVNGNGIYDMREPFGFYSGFVALNGYEDVTGVNIDLVEGGTGSIAGTVFYDGELSGKIYVGTFGLSDTPMLKVTLPTPGLYELGQLASGPMLVWAFLDVNGDKIPGLGEPIAIKPDVIFVKYNEQTSDVNLYLKPIKPSLVDVYELETYNVLVLEQNYPNPFNAETNIEYSLPNQSHASLKIFNMLGNLIYEMDLGNQPAGFHRLNWEAKDQTGKPLASGIYVYQIEADGFLATRKLLVVR
ncbi:T9SS type A sorting domain-containing protein [candidate division KSB1 bacterium]|nr:T9SS type A sorting domain-containing protein [candidate division KSB1 bacterium]